MPIWEQGLGPGGMEGSLRIALVNGSHRWDGHTRVFHMFREALEASGIIPQVYTCVDPSSASRFASDGSLVWGGRWPGGPLAEAGLNRLLPVYARRLRALPADLLHVNDVFLARAAAYRPDVVVTVADLGKLVTRWYPRASSLVHNLNARYLPRARGIVCLSEFARDSVRERFGLPEDRVLRVPPFAEPPVLPVRAAPPAPSAESPWRLLCVATDRPHKNLGLFLELLRRAGPSYRGILLSDVSEATLRRVRELGLKDRLEILRRTNDLRRLYAAAQVLILPSFYEGFGLPLLEAMSHALPILASDRTSVPEVVGPGGALLDPGDPSPWLEALRRLEEPGRYVDASRRSRDRAGDFPRERTSEALRNAYEVFRSAGPRRG